MDAAREWSFSVDGATLSRSVSGCFASNHGGALRLAALAGSGITRLPSFLVDPDLRAGTLVEVLRPHARTTRMSVWTLWPHDRHPSPKVRAFVDYAASQSARLGMSQEAVEAGLP